MLHHKSKALGNLLKVLKFFIRSYFIKYLFEFLLSDPEKHSHLRSGEEGTAEKADVQQQMDLGYGCASKRRQSSRSDLR